MIRHSDIEAHLAAIHSAEPSLEQSQLNVIREIIRLRRRIDPVASMARFRSLLDDGGNDLLRSFTTRWLVSVADTFADYGRGPERANAMIVVILANVTKLAETERRFLKDPGIDHRRQEELATPGTPLWDGMDSYAIKQGDMPNNMWTRVRTVMADTPALSFIFETVLSRMLACDTLIGRLAELNPNFYQFVEPIPSGK